MDNAQAFIDRVKAAAGKCLSYRNGNESGILWEMLWKYDGEYFWSKICASGVFVDWSKWDEAAAVRLVTNDLNVIHRTIER